MQALGQAAESNAARGQVVDDGEHVLRVVTESVELPDGEDVAKAVTELQLAGRPALPLPCICDWR